MTTREAGDDGMPDEVWLKFLTDSERAIRASAPREPSARERATRGESGAAAGGSGSEGPVGELWQPGETSADPAWRDLDTSARLRHAGRLVATAVAIALALAAWSWLSTSAGVPDAPGDGTVQQSERTPLPALPRTPESASLSSSLPAAG
ncbi:hypothetical protein ACK389_00240 [Streptomyces antibioticus]|uniref:Uncharacterized protein n=2 Tax=Streptomyces antibioticus TaxID=1890 RepID=A0AAE7CPH9_STRAT|nr:hypothetical protein [Streptomyces antibioticus]MCX4740937.1 hypothetical protein [Streptomyces antibioticus]MCX5173658.1 hypothetical protein [Streptomyces antibioticus]QIT48562.1 hypothetical protein HCX60_37775 [Streptomyces antibioticus]